MAFGNCSHLVSFGFCRLILAIAAVGFISGDPCWAGISSVGFDAELIAPPPSVALDALERNDVMNVFVEKTNFTLPTAVSVDILGAGRADMNPGFPPLSGMIPAGTRVDVFFVHFESIDEAEITRLTSIGTDAPILGVIHSDPRLDASDGLLGVPTTQYSTGVDLRGVVVHPTEGQFEFVEVIEGPGGIWSVRLNATVGAVQDQIRVITLTGVPEPAGFALALFAVLVGGCVRRRR